MKHHHDRFHFRCCLKPLFGALFWWGALASLFLAWLALYQGSVYGFKPDIWFNTGVILALLSIGLKGVYDWRSWLRSGHDHCPECHQKMYSEGPK